MTDTALVGRARRGAQRAPIIRAARRLIEEQGDSFTTQELIKEAGVALQTFYRYFGGKDQLLVAVIQETIAENCVLFAEQAAGIADPVERLRHYVMTALQGLSAEGGVAGPRFITSEHWRLHQLFPDEMSEATQPFIDLVRRELEAAAATGQLAPRDAERDAWLITRLVMAAFHHYAFLPNDAHVPSVADDVWSFCFAAVGGQPDAPRRRGLTRRRS